MTTKTLSSIDADEAAVELIDHRVNPICVHRASIRPEVAKFAIEMEAVLRENDHKSGWDEMTITDLFFRIKDEYEEFEQSYDLYVHPLIGGGEVQNEIHNMRKEAIDIANFCMFLCHNMQKVETVR